MASSTDLAAWLAPLVGVCVLAPDSAEACDPDPCYYDNFVAEIQAVNAVGPIPIDGVLLLQATGNDVGAIDLLAGLELMVTENGQPVAGALEDSMLSGVLIWRPDAPLTPGAAYKAVGSFDNPGAPDAYCADDILALDLDFVADMAGSDPLVAPDVAAEESVNTLIMPSLEALACCDDAFPELSYYMCGGGDDPYPTWYDGFCAPTQGHGYAQAGSCRGAARLTGPGMSGPSSHSGHRSKARKLTAFFPHCSTISSTVSRDGPPTMRWG